MTLGFTTTIKNKPTLFAERVLNAMMLDSKIAVDPAALEPFTAQMSLEQIRQILKLTPKLHTIRDDKHDRWKAGTVIHPVVHNRTPKRRQFAPTFPCTGIQEVFMTYHYGNIIQISVDDRELVSFHDRLDFAINDGFENWDDFFNWFYPIIMASDDKFYKGKIIHFSDVRY